MRRRRFRRREIVDGQAVRTRPLCAYPRRPRTKEQEAPTTRRISVCRVGRLGLFRRRSHYLRSCSSQFVARAAACAVAVAVARAQQPAPSRSPVPWRSRARRRRLARLSVQRVDARPAKQGYVEEEFFIQGTARSYDIPRDQMSNGTPADATHPYKTRIVVRRPAAAGEVQRHGRSSSGRTSPKASTTRWTGSTSGRSLRAARATRGSACRRRTSASAR